jgi:AcrR family transcriptional regulator
LTSVQSDTRARILEAAFKLFDAEGIRGGTVDRIAKEAGVTKRTIYYYFRSKDDLIAQALADQSATERHVLDLLIRGSGIRLETNIMQLFAEIAQYSADPRWKGCAFIRASVELAGLPGHPAVRAARDHRKYVERTFVRELAEMNIEQAANLARRLALLLDGAIMATVVHHEPSYAVEAGRLAVSLVRTARLRPSVAEDEPTDPAAHAVLDCTAQRFGEMANS